MRILLTLVVCLLCGCASGYTKFYRSATGVTPDGVAKNRAAPPPKVPALERAGGASADIVAAYAQRGYALIGYSSFNSGRRESESGAVAQGAEVGADLVVVVDPRYTGSVSTTVPITTPTATTSYTTGTATAYGPGGPVTAYGNATTMTYGSQTSYLPLTIHRFDYGALYLYKRRWVFGALFRDLNDEERRTLQSNKGVFVTTLVYGSPAFAADILAGDIITLADGQPVFGQQGFTALLVEKRGRTVQLTILRGGQTITKSVALAQ